MFENRIIILEGFLIDMGGGGKLFSYSEWCLDLFSIL